MKRIAVVVQRCHPDVTGGSEALAWQYAQLLAATYEVDVLTSCALDYARWDNALDAGVEERDGVRIRRFPTAFPRGGPFYALHRRLLAAYAAAPGRPLPWRRALAEEFIRFQGPWCPGLVEHLAAQHGHYAAFVFCTYLYPTTYFGLGAVPAPKTLLVPTLHDEPPAWLPAFAERAAGCAQIAWLTEAERAAGARLWNVERGDVVGMAVASERAVPAVRERPYLLYCGRIDPAKGCGELLAAHAALRRRRPELELVLTGTDLMQAAGRPGVRFLGHVEAAHKTALMAGCAAFVMPSPYESFSIATLEALAQGAPVVVNGACDVLAEHVRRAGCGFAYRDADGFVQALEQALDLDAPQRAAGAQCGIRYVTENYTEAAVAARLRACVARIAD